MRSKTPIGPMWRSKFEVVEAQDDIRPQPPAWYGKDFDDSDWETVELPEWRYTLSQHGKRESKSCIIWYRTNFSASPSRDGQRIFLVFEGVDWEAQVWLNGKRLGTHRTYYEPFRFDVTDLLEENNTLAVRILDGPRFGEPIAYWSLFPLVPAEQMRYVPDRAKSVIGHRNGDLHVGNGFGIHRDVYLETTADPCISAVFARGNPAQGEAHIQVETDATAAKRVTLGVEIMPENFSGPSYCTKEILEVPKGAEAKTLVVKMPAAKVWSPQTPYLYRCRTTLKQDGQIVDSRDVLFGNRSFAIVSEKHPRQGLQAGTLLLNDKPIFLRGTNINGFNALVYWGRREQLIDVMLMLKAGGFNAVRSCQHVCYPEVRELMDRLGIMSEQDQGGCRGEKRDASLQQLQYCGRALARECYNNPGVVLLSFANETDFDPSKIVEAVLKVDPQRIITPISGNPHGGDVYPHKGRSAYSLSNDLWANVVGNCHPYRGWYSYPGQIWKISKRLEPDRMVLLGEYGGEALDAYERWPAITRRTSDLRLPPMPIRSGVKCRCKKLIVSRSLVSVAVVRKTWPNMSRPARRTKPTFSRRSAAHGGFHRGEFAAISSSTSSTSCPPIGPNRSSATTCVPKKAITPWPRSTSRSSPCWKSSTGAKPWTFGWQMIRMILSTIVASNGPSITREKHWPPVQLRPKCRPRMRN